MIHQSAAGTDDSVSSTSPGTSPLPSPGIRHPGIHEHGYSADAAGSVAAPPGQYYDPFESSLLSTKVHSATDAASNVPWCFDPAVWDKTLTELMQESTAIRNANLAVHTLVFSRGPSPMSFGGQSGRDHYGEALICHGLALHEAGRATSDLREAVICCMFFVVFETINGDRQAAHSHVQSGKKMLWELRGGACESDEFQNSLRYVVQCIAKQARDFRVPRGFSWKSENDELLSGFIGV